MVGPSWLLQLDPHLNTGRDNFSLGNPEKAVYYSQVHFAHNSLCSKTLFCEVVAKEQISCSVTVKGAWTLYHVQKALNFLIGVS